MPLLLSSQPARGHRPATILGLAGTGIFLGWAPETLTLCGSLEGSSDCMPLAGICVVLKADLGSGGDPDMNLGRQIPHHIPEGGWVGGSCTFHPSRTAKHSIKSFMSRAKGACDPGERRRGQCAGWGGARRALPAHSQPGPLASLVPRQLKGARRGSRGSGHTRRLALGRAPALRPRHYFGWCRPRPHLRRPGSAGSRRVAPHLGPGPPPSAAMSGRSVPHAHPATAEYEFANPSRLGEQRFGEGMARAPLGLLPPPPAILGWPPDGAGLHPTPA